MASSKLSQSTNRLGNCSSTFCRLLWVLGIHNQEPLIESVYFCPGHRRLLGVLHCSCVNGQMPFILNFQSSDKSWRSLNGMTSLVMRISRESVVSDILPEGVWVKSGKPSYFVTALVTVTQVRLFHHYTSFIQSSMSFQS